MVERIFSVQSRGRNEWPLTNALEGRSADTWHVLRSHMITVEYKLPALQTHMIATKNPVCLEIY